MSESWWEYVQRISARALNKEIAAAARCDPTAVSHWKAGKRPGADNVVALARAYDRSPLEALVAAGYLTPEDVDDQRVVEVSASVQDITDEELAQENARRLMGYGSIIEELTRRAATNDPRQIEPGSADDVFPPFGDDAGGPKRRAWVY